MLSFEALDKLWHTQAQGAPTPPKEIRRWFTDSREVGSPQGALFFALPGKTHQGVDFLDDLYQQGFRTFVVPHSIPSEKFPEATWWVHSSPLQALQQLAQTWRQQFSYPLVGITGSNGKTIVKEWLSQLALSTFDVVKSPKSYNSQIGVPLSLGLMRDHHTLGIFEAGISQHGEMAALAKMLQPTIGIFTNLGTAHDEGFASWEEKLAEKAALFESVNTLIYHGNNPEVTAYFQRRFPTHQHWVWGPESPISTAIHGQNLTITWGNKPHTFSLPFLDPVSVENVCHCLVLLLGIGISDAKLQEGLQWLRPPNMRLSLKDGLQDCGIIDDTYNNDLAGLDIALHFMDRQPPRRQKTVILSDMEETGIGAQEMFHTIQEKLAAHQVHQWIGVGPQHLAFARQAEGPQRAFPSTKDLIQALPSFLPQQELVLIKGARSFGFEQVVSALEQKVHGTVLEVDLEALTHNLNTYRRRLKPDTKLMVMVKALAYGNGSEEIAHLLQYHRVDYLAVAYADEGVRLRERGVTLPIMVMNPEPSTFHKLLQHQLEAEVYSFRLLHQLGEFVRRSQATTKVHLKIDTGMRRLGFEPEEVPTLLAELAAYPELIPVTVFSHLAGADEAQHADFSARQVKLFSEAAQQLNNNMDTPLIRHILNSPGIVRFPQWQFDMVRLGIGLYGIEAAGMEQDMLQPVSRLWATVSQVKSIDSGETVGYGRAGLAYTPSKVATLAIGYADGFDRGFSKGVGHVLINGQKAPVIGNVCMDMTMVDVTNISVEEGDRALIFGPELPLGQLAQKIATIPYELLTNVSTRVKRVYFAG